MLLRAAFSPTRLAVVNDSGKHYGHSGDDGSGESHFTVEIEAAAFASVSRLERQLSSQPRTGNLAWPARPCACDKARAPGEVLMADAVMAEQNSAPLFQPGSISMSRQRATQPIQQSSSCMGFLNRIAPGVWRWRHFPGAIAVSRLTSVAMRARPNRRRSRTLRCQTRCRRVLRSQMRSASNASRCRRADQAVDRLGWQHSVDQSALSG